MENESDNTESVEQDNLIVRVMRDFRSALTTPNLFFDQLDYDGSLLEPFTFHLIVSVVNALGRFLVASFSVSELVIGFLWMFIGGFFAAGFLWLAGKALGGEAQFRQVYRGVGFALAPLLFAWIPLLLIICYAYMLYLFRKVVEKVFELDDKTTNLIVIAFVVVLFLIGLGFVGYGLAKIFGGRTTPGLE